MYVQIKENITKCRDEAKRNKNQHKRSVFCVPTLLLHHLQTPKKYYEIWKFLQYILARDPGRLSLKSRAFLGDFEDQGFYGK